MTADELKALATVMQNCVRDVNEAVAQIGAAMLNGQEKVEAFNAAAERMKLALQSPLLDPVPILVPAPLVHAIEPMPPPSDAPPPVTEEMLDQPKKKPKLKVTRA